MPKTMEVVPISFKQPTFPFVVLVVLFALIIYSIKRNKDSVDIRKITGLEAIEEGVGRATEIGRPVFATPGAGSVDGNGSVETMAAIEVLSHIARLTAKYKVPLTVGVRFGSTYSVADQTVKEAYSAVNAADAYNEDMVQFYSEDEYGFAAACVGHFMRVRPGAIFIFGRFAGVGMMVFEGAAQSGALTVGGMTSFNQLPMMVASLDYTLIGEELYAAGAYLSKNQAKLQCIRAADAAKIIAAATMAIGMIAATLGNTSIAAFLK